MRSPGNTCSLVQFQRGLWCMKTSALYNTDVSQSEINSVNYN